MKQLSSPSRSNLIGDLAASHALLNCLIKEFALPMSLVKYEWPQDMRGIPIGVFFNGEIVKGTPLYIKMPNLQEFFILVDRQDCLGSHYYLSDIYGKQNQDIWQYLDFGQFVIALVDSCSDATGQKNNELIEQIFESRALKEKIYNYASKEKYNCLENYRRSEQALWFGHPTHPAPKARLWSLVTDQLQYSPEFGSCSALHQFEVNKSDLWIKANGLDDNQVLAGVADQINTREERAVISLHPVQAKLFIADPRTQHLLKLGVIKDLGCNGHPFYPTASIRTWFSPQHDYFIKGSLHVRITNCVRKNAWYELESTILIDAIFKELMSNQMDSLGGFEPVEEPAVLCWCPSDAQAEDKNWFKEQTGIILRHNFCKEEGEQSCLLAGTVFGRSTNLTPNILGFLEEASPKNLQEQDLLNWFKQYQALLLRPVLFLFYNHGIVMEPHLQNTILVHQQGQPKKILLRDFEGVKLTSDVGMNLIANKQIHPRVQQSMEYSRHNGWQRVCYCLFVNNISEAILALTWKRPTLATKMWDIVHDELKTIRTELRRPTPELDALLNGGPIHCKTNFKVRLAAEADRKAGYVELQSPWEKSYV
ncbi:IucA/IucC family protein [Acinetobacter courvalinii]|uniref:Siderophore biosynthesis protein IucA n=2 Tax=Gammaproteobacteria TaxID=1236 RepID=N9REA6_9GAMM|nr:IucA/IucC family protein [Acinetobacter courvalinii]ENX37472.1 hypothetical protein F888_02809 [Acinetobacter courvalinii]KAB0658824.1 IucA/IucC family siderophore biosynthesis protein [Acinetobacter courvalinii]RSN84746.1 IucA/IucC family siderophore biosynthesis protein [Acinetobacter baumannii]GGH27121.1 siderophore biosynthesis protein IucA [Acinetobacter courvalinii]